MLTKKRHFEWRPKVNIYENKSVDWNIYTFKWKNIKIKHIFNFTEYAQRFLSTSTNRECLLVKTIIASKENSMNDVYNAKFSNHKIQLWIILQAIWNKYEYI